MALETAGAIDQPMLIRASRRAGLAGGDGPGAAAEGHTAIYAF